MKTSYAIEGLKDNHLLEKLLYYLKKVIILWHYYVIVWFQNVYDIFDKHALYCVNGKTVTLREFQKFLVVEQSDAIGNNESEVSSYIRDYLHDPQRDVHNPYFTLAEVSL